jgi:protein involved in polysaccharide export with SLBB domain
MVTKSILFIVGFLAFSQWTALADMPATRPSNEFYIRGDVTRPGVWPIGDKPKSVLTAIESAELKDGKADYEVTIYHRTGAGRIMRITTFPSLNALRESPDEATDLSPSDVVQVKLIKA